MPTPPMIPEGLTEHGKDLIAAVWDAEPQLHRLPNGVVAMPPSPLEAAKVASRDVGAANLDEALTRVHTNERDHTVSLLLDEHTAAVVIYAARLLFADCEAHSHELMVTARTLPPNSYGALNRMEQVLRQRRITRRLAALDVAYRQAVEVEMHGI